MSKSKTKMGPVVRATKLAFEASLASSDATCMSRELTHLPPTPERVREFAQLNAEASLKLQVAASAMRRAGVFRERDTRSLERRAQTHLREALTMLRVMP